MVLYLKTALTPVCTAFLILTWTAVSLRCWTRLMIVKRFGWDDAAMVCTLLVFTGFCSCMIQVDLTTGCRTVNQIGDGQLVLNEVNIVLATLLMYIIDAFLLKVSLGLLLLRVVVRTWMKIVIYCAMAVPVCYGTFYFFFVLWECGPPKYFQILILIHHCLAPHVIDATCYLHTTLNATADSVFCILPFFLLRDLDMNFRQKFSLVTILGLGSVGSIVSFIRLGFVSELATPGPRFLVKIQPLAYLSTIELGLGICCGSLAACKPLFQQYFHHGRPSQYGSHSSGYGRHSAQLRNSVQYCLPEVRSDQGYNRLSRSSTAATFESKPEYELKHSYKTNSAVYDQALEEPHSPVFKTNTRLSV